MDERLIRLWYWLYSEMRQTVSHLNSNHLKVTWSFECRFTIRTIMLLGQLTAVYIENGY